VQNAHLMIFVKTSRCPASGKGARRLKAAPVLFSLRPQVAVMGPPVDTINVNNTKGFLHENWGRVEGCFRTFQIYYPKEEAQGAANSSSGAR
jgi:hypothetical protein